MKIAIATKSRYKINAILKSLHEVDFDFEYVSVDASSDISEQPNKAGETREGSINRAMNAVKEVQDADLAIGVEFGYEPENGIYRMHCWATIIDRDGNIYSEQSSTLQLPKALQEKLDQGIDVSDSLDLVLNSLEDSERNRLFRSYIKKRIFIYESVKAVILRYLLDEVAY